MRLSCAVPLVISWATTLVSAAVPLPPGVPRDVVEFRTKHRYEPPKHHCRRTVTIRSSEDVDDDVSQEFLDGVLEANNGGTLYLPDGEMFVIGKVLDLTGLNDIHIHLDGEIRVSPLLRRDLRRVGA